MAGSTVAPLSLRERKKQRTRRDLADTALHLFAENGYDATRIDHLVASVDVSKRTFFRYFDSKEAVALAAEAELWDAYVDAVSHSTPERRVLATLREALIHAIDDMPDDWPQRLLRTRALIGRTPGLRAASMMMAAGTQERLVGTLAPRTGLDKDDMRLRLIVEVAFGAYRCGAKDWVSDRKRGGRKVLGERIHAAFNAVGDVVHLESRPGDTPAT